MFLIEPFIWMFSMKSFKRHYLYLILTAAICWGLTFLIYLFRDFIFSSDYLFVNILLIVLTIMLIILPILCLTGYFWCMTDNIIMRKSEPRLKSTYNDKNNGIINIIELPDWNIRRFVWRGIASCVASIFLYVPFTILMYLVVFNLALLNTWWSIDPAQIQIIMIIIATLFILLLPGLLWNYATRDSVVAILNVFRAVYIMESYPLKYFFNSFLIALFSFLRSFIMRTAVIALGYGAILTSLNVQHNNADLISNPQYISVLIILLIVGYLIDTYWIFVNAFLLGTITPSGEY